jgi:hypothetical protein
MQSVVCALKQYTKYRIACMYNVVLVIPITITILAHTTLLLLLLLVLCIQYYCDCVCNYDYDYCDCKVMHSSLNVHIYYCIHNIHIYIYIYRNVIIPHLTKYKESKLMLIYSVLARSLKHKNSYSLCAFVASMHIYCVYMEFTILKEKEREKKNEGAM